MARFTAVLYHSAEWSVLVEAGWITLTVDGDGWALMVKWMVK